MTNLPSPNPEEKPTFEQSIALIDNEINKRKSRWTLTAIAWMDFEDIAQILRIHIHKKWHLYDASRPLAPWLNRVISSQIKNLIRNIYGNYSRPCLRCAAAESDNLCSIYGKQCNGCPLYDYWEKNKKSAYDVKLPVYLENHAQEVFNLQNDAIDIEKTASNIHEKMHKALKPIEWKIYKMLYIENKTEEEVARAMGYKTTEKGRSAGYKQMKNIKKVIIKKVKKLLYSGEVDIV
jgi:DNA-directed RNA polymerase specialized sigma24 family protein